MPAFYVIGVVVVVVVLNENKMCRMIFFFLIPDFVVGTESRETLVWRC